MMMSLLIRCLTDVVYLLGALLALPVWLPVVVLREKYRRHWWERFGGVPRRPSSSSSPLRPFVWIHAVSVGEVRAAQAIVAELEKTWPEAEIGISATTKTGRATAAALFPQRLTYQYPLDLSWCVSRALKRLRPQLVVLMELEVWPNFVRGCAARDIPVVVANGRLSERSYPGYRRFRWLLGPVFRRLSLVLAQTDAVAQRFVDVGVEAQRVRSVGSVKYDGVAVERDTAAAAEQRNAVRERFGVAEAEQVLVAGSTHPPEHEPLVRCWHRLRSETGKQVRLVIVPRHPEKPQPAAYLAAQGIPCVRLSELEQGNSVVTWPAEAVLLGDVMGRLLELYAMADVAFVGKSLPGVAEGGGQNPLEPAALGVATVFGPLMRNFDSIAADLVERHAALQVADEATLLEALRTLLGDASKRQSLAAAAQQAVEAGRGAATRTAEALRHLVETDGTRQHPA